MKLFLRTWVPGWWEDKTAKQREDYTKYMEHSSGYYNTVRMMCRLLNIDETTLMAMVKSINRWEKHGGKFDRETCIHVTYCTEKNVRRSLSNGNEWNGYYKSTGRKDLTF